MHPHPKARRSLRALSLWFFIQLLICLCMTSCTRNEFISAQTSYITRQALASYHVGTPDPYLCTPIYGQHLIVKWSLPTSFKAYSDLRIAATLRFRNRAQNTLVIPINIPSGIYVYTLRDNEFCETKGILTYKLELLGGNCLLQEWKHQLWVELITVPPQSE